MLYANGVTHFAPTHPAEVSVYNPESKADRKIYPMKPYQAIRLDYVAKVKAVYDKLGRQWFMDKNHQGNHKQTYKGLWLRE